MKIEIDVNGDPQLDKRILLLGNFIGQHLKQEMVFVTIEDIQVLSIKAIDNDHAQPGWGNQFEQIGAEVMSRI